MKNTSIILVVVLLLMAGGICLQIFLSKKNSKWFGLILPLICFGYSLIMVFSIAIFDGMTGWNILVLIASTFFMANIPTIVLLGIYFGCREKVRRRKELDKMHIQDLG